MKITWQIFFNEKQLFYEKLKTNNPKAIPKVLLLNKALAGSKQKAN